MKHLTYIFLVLIIFLSDCKNHNTNINTNTYMGVDIIDAYELAFDRTYIFNDFNTFITEIGLPNTVSVFRDTISISSKEELDKLIASSIQKGGTDIINLQYTGFQMGFMPDDRIVPENIDFRKTDKSIQYNGTTFDQTYTVDMFKKQFPSSGSFALDNEMSLFGMTTNERDEGLKHYMLLRKSKDDPYAEPTLELTFKNNKLIYIFFANF